MCWPLWASCFPSFPATPQLPCETVSCRWKHEDFALNGFAGSKDAAGYTLSSKGWNCPEFTRTAPEIHGAHQPSWRCQKSSRAKKTSTFQDGKALRHTYHSTVTRRPNMVTRSHNTGLFRGTSWQLPRKNTKAGVRWKTGLFTPAIRTQFCYFLREGKGDGMDIPQLANEEKRNL